MLIFLKDANATTKGFLKAASENTNGFQNAAGV